MRNPLKRQSSADPKPTLRERAAALRTSAGQIMHPAASPPVFETVALPAPGSDEARDAFAEACREHSRLTLFANDYPELKRTPLEWWTRDTLSRARELGEISAEECARLHPIASDRELRIDEVSHRLKLGALHALAFADEPPMPAEPEPVDWHTPPAGFMAHPAIEPAAFVNIRIALPLEAERLHGIAEAEFERRRKALQDHDRGPEKAERIAEIRRSLRLDAWAAVAAEPGETGEAGLDAALLALEAEFIEAHRVVLEISAAHDAAYEKLDEPAMPNELRVWQNDWLYTSIPRPGLIPLVDGRGRQLPYGLKEVKTLRANPCVCVVVGGAQGEPRQGGGRIIADLAAQARADAIVAAWDRWQAEISARKEALNLTNLLAQVQAAEDRRLEVLRRVRPTPAKSLVGLGVKARIAFALSSGLNPRDAGARSYDDEEFEAFVFDLAGDALAIAGEAPSARLEHAPATDQLTTPDHDLSGCTLPQLARLYEAWEGIFHHLNAVGSVPCFLDSDRNFTPAGEVLDREYDRAAGFLSVIADETAKRTPATANDRDERLSVLVRHEMNTNGRPADASLLAELNAAEEA